MEAAGMTELRQPRIVRVGRKKPKISDETARIVLEWKEAGISTSETADILGVHRTTVTRLRRKARHLIAAERGTTIEEPIKRNREDRGKREDFRPTLSPRGKRIGRPPKVTDEILSLIVSMQAAGVSIPATSQRLGIGETAIKRARRRGRYLAEAAWR